MEKVSSSQSIECRGIQYREQELTEPALPSDRSVSALVVMFRDGSTEVCCPYLTRSSASVGINKCSAGYSNQDSKKVLPNCVFQKIGRGVEEIPNLPSKIEELLTEKGWNQKKLSEESGVDASIVSRIMTGKVRNPESETLQKLQRALGKNLRTLLPIEPDQVS
jgi:DNA-binding Xre family transcriptional regulator